MAEEERYRDEESETKELHFKPNQRRKRDLRVDRNERLEEGGQVRRMLVRGDR